jgi:hypothetical protein
VLLGRTNPLPSAEFKIQLVIRLNELSNSTLHIQTNSKEVKDTLRLAISQSVCQSVCLGVELSLGPMRDINSCWRVTLLLKCGVISHES